MTHRLRSVWLGVALVGALTAPASVIAVPPDLMEHYKLSADRWGLHQLHPTARRTLAGSMLFSIHPALALLSTEKMLDLPSDHPPPLVDEYVTMRFQEGAAELRGRLIFRSWSRIGEADDDDEGRWWKRHFFPSSVAEPTPLMKQNDGFVQDSLTCGEDFAYVAATEPAVEESETVSLPVMEVLPMPAENTETTCPYLRQQMIDRNACQLADPEMNRAVLDNLKCLEKADKLLERAKEQASVGRIRSALKKCLRIQELCPGSPCAERAFQSMLQWVFGEVEPASAAEEAAEPQANSVAEPSDGGCKRVWFGDDGSTDEPDGGTCPPTEESTKKDAESIPAEPKPGCVLRSRECEPGIQEQVCGMMKACHLLVNQGLYHQAAALAQQAFALDPQCVMADPLIAQMRLLDASMTQPASKCEEKEPPTCPYCGMGGKPIRDIVQEPKKNDEQSATLVPSLPPIAADVVPALDQELTEAGKAEPIIAGAEEMAEALLERVGLSVPDVHSDADGGLRFSGECCVGGNVYHLRYERGSLNVWKTMDASTSPR